MLSKEADLRTTPEGKKSFNIYNISVIKNTHIAMPDISFS